jgi:hypothetical protein
MAEQGFTKLRVEALADDVVLAIRQNPDTMVSYVLVSRSAFSPAPNAYIDRLSLPGVLKKVEFAAQVKVQGKALKQTDSVAGLEGRVQLVHSVEQWGRVSSNSTSLEHLSLPVGSVILLLVSPPDEPKRSMLRLRDNKNQGKAVYFRDS